MHKDRIEYIDALKGLLIILVVIGHTGINSGIQKWIYSFHMPLFLIISGFFYKEDKNIIVYKRVKRLLGPFLVYTVMAVGFPGLPWLIFKSQVIEWERVFYLKERIFFNTPIWFLIVLFFIEIKMNIIGRIFSNKQQVRKLVLLILIQILTIKYCPMLPFGIRIGLASCSTFYIGVLWRENIKYFSFSRKISNLILIFLLPITLFCGYKFGRIDVYTMQFSDNLFEYYLLIGLNFLVWIEICKRLVNIKILKLFGKNTIYILGLHYYILLFMGIGLKLLKIQEELIEKIGLYFIQALIVLILSYTIIKIKEIYICRIEEVKKSI